jgi:hypothetical protein
MHDAKFFRDIRRFVISHVTKRNVARFEKTLDARQPNAEIDEHVRHLDNWRRTVFRA